MTASTVPRFHIPSRDFEPAYLSLYRSGELQKRARQAVESLGFCRGCPRRCGGDRLAERLGVCKTGRFARVNSYFPHRGEEECLRGWRGSGTVFFTGCSLRCPFCQNFGISHTTVGEAAPPERLAQMLLELEAARCHNINLVTPSHVVPQILEALVLAVKGGLRLPIVYNTSAYDSMTSLHWLDGVVDIYMPDFKVWDAKAALKYLSARNYPEMARGAIREMQRQVGELKLDENGLAKRGVLVRHLVMPGDVAGIRHIARFLVRQISCDTFVNIMAQYSPAGKVSADKLPEINRRITPEEYGRAIAAARNAGLHRFA